MPDNKSTHLKILLRGITGSFFIRATSLGLLFITQILLARVLGASEFGAYSLVIAWIVVLSRLTTGGLDTAATRFVSQYRSNDDWDSISHFKRHAEKVIMLLATLTIPAFWVALYTTPGTIKFSSFWLSGAALLLMLTILLVRQSILQGLLQISKSLIPDAIIRPAVLAVISALVLLLDVSFNASEILFTHLLAAFAALVISSLFLKTIRHHKTDSHPHASKQKEWSLVRWPLYGITVIYVAQANIGTIMLACNTRNGLVPAECPIDLFVTIGGNRHAYA